MTVHPLQRVYIIVVSVVITVNYNKCVLYSLLNSKLYVHWILDFKSILLVVVVVYIININCNDNHVTHHYALSVVHVQL